MKPRMFRRLEYVTIGVFTFIFLVYGFWALSIGDIFRFYVVLLPALGVSLLPLAFEYAMKVTFPPGVKPLVSLALLLHVAGGIGRLYWVFAPFFDKVAHVISALALFLLIICFFSFLDYMGREISWRTVIIGALVITTVLMVSWEISEYLIDVMARSTYNNGIIDSIEDLIGDVIGIVIGIWIVRYYRGVIPSGKSPGYLFRL